MHFGTILSIFFPCFTGILSGANRADILQDPPRDIRRGTLGAICFSFVMYTSFMILWGAVAKYEWLRGDFGYDVTKGDAKGAHDGHRRLAGFTELGFERGDQRVKN